MFAHNMWGHIRQVDETYVYLDRVKMAQSLFQCQEEVHLGPKQIAVAHQKVGAVAEQDSAKVVLFQ